LMIRLRADCARQFNTRRVMHRHTRFSRYLKQLAQTIVARAFSNREALDCALPRAQRFEHGRDTVEMRVAMMLRCSLDLSIFDESLFVWPQLALVALCRLITKSFLVAAPLHVLDSG